MAKKNISKYYPYKEFCKGGTSYDKRRKKYQAINLKQVQVDDGNNGLYPAGYDIIGQCAFCNHVGVVNLELQVLTHYVTG